MYILVCNGEIVGLYTSHTDAHEAAQDYPKVKVYYAQPNSNVVSLWDTI